MIRVAIVTISDKSSLGERDDGAGPAIRDALRAEDIDFSESEYRLIPDEQRIIADVLEELCQRDDIDLVLTTGGTGLAPRDVTPQATRGVIEYDVPGLSEAMRAESLKVTPAGMLSRGVAGVLHRTLIVNLPGNPKAVGENLHAIAAALPHAITTLQGQAGEHSRPEASSS
jgi:molybdopterin adenylyltransferase